MSHTTHTNEEFSQVLTALLQERKKVQELEQQLLTLQEGRESDESNEKIKSMFLMLKKKYAQALHALNDKEKKLHELERTQSQYETLKAAYTQNSKKAEIAEEEALSLRQQHTTLVTHLREAQENTTRIKEELDQLADRLQNSNQMRDALEKENLELKSLRDEYQYLKVQAEASQLKADELAEKLSGSHEQGATIESLKEERDKLAEALTENLKRADQLDKVGVFLRERNQEAQNEISLLKESLIHLEKDKALLAQELKNTQEENTLQKQQQKVLENEIKEVRDQLQTVQSLAASLQVQIDATSLKMQEAEQLKAKSDALTTEKDQLAKELLDQKAALEERDARIKIAQQHLAKKVKETNSLLDRAEEHKAKTFEMQSTIESYKLKIAEMQHTLDTQIQQEKRIEENLLDSLKTAEIQARRWEEKYFLMCDKWQQAETYGRELKGLEEKFNQVQAVFASLGNIVNSVPPLSKPVQHEVQKPLRHGLEDDVLF